MRILALLALVASATAQRLGDLDGATCVTEVFGTSPQKSDFLLPPASLKAILSATPNGPTDGRNVEGISIGDPTAALTTSAATFGARGRTLRRLTPNAFADGFDVPRGTCVEGQMCMFPKANEINDGSFVGSNLPNPRLISNLISTSTAVLASRRNLADLTGHFGQFLAHDTTLVPEGEEVFDIVVPEGDPVFDPESKGNQLMGFQRALTESRCSGVNPRGSLIGADEDDRSRDLNNEITSFIDATMIYGGTNGREALLRDPNANRPGQLRTSRGNLLPFNTFPPSVDTNSDNPRGMPTADLPFGGDVRTAEAPGLTLLITIFVREHNRLARHHQLFLQKTGGTISSDIIYAWAKKMLIAELQNIAYSEWLPALYGEPFAPFTGHNPATPADLFHEFSAATRRFGHSMINGFIPVVYGGNNLRGCHRADLATHLFNTVPLINWRDGGIEPILRGILCIRSQQLDTVINPGLQTRLFAPAPGGEERDLMALNIMRARDHGVADYNTVRVALGLPAFTKFSQINPSDPDLTRRLAEVYGDISKVDLFIGALAEAPALATTGHGNAEFGETIRAMFNIQFANIRDSDSRFFRNVLSAAEIAQLPSFGDIVRRNSRIYPGNLFPKHSIFFHTLFCRDVRNFQCVPRSARKENILCDKVYELADLANSSQPSSPSLTFPWRIVPEPGSEQTCGSRHC